MDKRILTVTLRQVLGCSIRRVRWTRHVECMREMRNIDKSLVGRPERKRPLGRTGYKWEDNINMGIVEIMCGGVNWIHLAQERVMHLAFVNTVMNLKLYNDGPTKWS
jgi:hypothetical protein